MANAKSTTVFDICDAKVYEMTADVTGASAPVYGAAIDIPGIGALSGFDPQIVSAQIKGDCRVLARQGHIESINGSVTFGKVAIPVLDAINDGSAWTSGLDEGFRFYGGSSLKYFKFEGFITGVDVGITQVKLVAYKAQATSQQVVDQSSDNFGQPKFDFNAIGIDAGVAIGSPGSPPALEVTSMVDVVITNAA